MPCQSGSDQLPIVNKTDTHKPCCLVVCPQEIFQRHQFGMILEHLPHRCSVVESTSSMADSLAKTSAVPALEKAWAQSEADYSLKLQGSQMNFDLPLSFLKMSLPLKSLCHSFGPSLRDLVLIAETAFSQREILAQRCARIKGGSYWQRPRASEYFSLMQKKTAAQVRLRKNGGKKQQDITTRAIAATGHPAPIKLIETLMGLRPAWTALEDWAMQWFRNKQG